MPARRGVTGGLGWWQREAPRRPGFIPPMLASTRPLPASEQGRSPWVFERKFDGFRTIAVTGPHPRLWSRSGRDVTDRFSNLLEGLPTRPAVLDSEAIAYVDGREAFAEVQNGRATHLAVFDVMNLDGHDVRGQPWHRRHGLLQELDLRAPCVRSPAVEGDPKIMLERACRAGWEGLIAKLRDSPYTSGRSMAWRKLKCIQRQEFVIGGYTPPQGGRIRFGALLLGYHDDGLRFAGKVGTGFDDLTLARLHEAMQAIRRNDPPFEDPPRGPATWVEPRLVCDIEYTEWTPDGRLRHPCFKGLRRDKRPEEVVRET